MYMVDTPESMSQGIAYLMGALNSFRGIKAAQVAFSRNSQKIPLSLKASLNTDNPKSMTLTVTVGATVQAFNFTVSGVNFYAFQQSTVEAGAVLESEVRRILMTGAGEITGEMLETFAKAVPADAFRRYLLYLVSLRMSASADMDVISAEHLAAPLLLGPLYNQLGNDLVRVWSSVVRPVETELPGLQSVLNMFPFDSQTAVYLETNVKFSNATFAIERENGGFLDIWQISVSKFAFN